MKKKNTNDNCTTGFFFFLFIIRSFLKSNTRLCTSFFRKNKYNVYFIKSCIRYKISKHLINRLCNRFVVSVDFGSSIKNLDFFRHIFFFKMFSAVYFNVNFIRVIKSSNFQKFLTLLC